MLYTYWASLYKIVKIIIAIWLFGCSLHANRYNEDKSG